ncbi:hypothetical protein SWZG_00240 [Synechococcus phage S-SKS1]|uniref:Uncharacterized protein n=1 Tax=Synechococcus phage S-SKS1 TaxID=754042 RepID=M4QPP3_9CAUD|nr:hypothetical protein SWZG_00240 [Synechococcus phage S-SKS1]AGH31746.1 hypothetical protein SWZG_00240 [Synechococcus phage S-SKS1]
MNLITCSGCGVVYDAAVLHFPKDVWKDDEYGGETIDDTKAVWDDYYGAYFPKVDCRVCGTAIQSKEKAH